MTLRFGETWDTAIFFVVHLFTTKVEFPERFNKSILFKKRAKNSLHLRICVIYKRLSTSKEKQSEHLKTIYFQQKHSGRRTRKTEPRTLRGPKTLWGLRILWGPTKDPVTYKLAKVSWFPYHVFNMVEFTIKGRFIYYCWMQVNLKRFVKLKICTN